MAWLTLTASTHSLLRMKTTRFYITVLALLCSTTMALADDKPSPTAISPVTTQAPMDPKYANLGPDERDILDRGEISQGQYIGGGIVATLVGFGIGHAIQSRYQDPGWIFTTGELGSAALVGVGGISCVISVMEGNHTCETGAAIMIIGSLGFAGFRVWEALDAWITPPWLNKRYHELKQRIGISEFLLNPIAVNDQLGLGLTIKF